MQLTLETKAKFEEIERRGGCRASNRGATSTPPTQAVHRR